MDIRVMVTVLIGGLALTLSACDSSSPQSVNTELTQSAETETIDTQQEPNTTKVKVTTINDELASDTGAQYEVSYETNEGEKAMGFMDVSGNITQEEPKSRYSHFEGRIVTLYDEEGNETYTTPDEEFWNVVACHDDVYLAEQIRSGLDESATYIGLIDSNGNWLSEQINLTEKMEKNPALVTDAGYLGENLIGALYTKEHTESILLFNTETYVIEELNGISSANSYLMDSFLCYRDGLMIFETQNDGIACVDSSGNVNPIPAEGNLLDVTENGFITNNQGLSMYSPSGDLLWSFNEYEIVEDKPTRMIDDIVVTYLLGADGDTYVAALSQDDGSLIYEPFEDEYAYICDHYLLTSRSSNNCVIDLLTGEVVNDLPDFELESVEFYRNGVYITRKAGTGLLFFDPEGNEITPHIAG